MKPISLVLAIVLLSAVQILRGEFIPSAAAATPKARTVFEGFYRIERGTKHVGFVVQRYRHEGNRRILTSYLRMRQADDAEIFESFKSTSDQNGQPIASEHRGNGEGMPAIFARFTGARGRVDFGTPDSRRPATVDGYDFLSSFLFFATNLPRLTGDRAFRYHAFAEERGQVSTGTLHLAGVSDVRGIKTYQIVDDFLGEPVENFVAANGQPLGSRALGADLICYWVPTREAAIDMFTYPNRDVITTFGDLPTGRANVWASVKDFNADREVRAMPKWRGKRILTPRELASASVLPRRAL